MSRCSHRVVEDQCDPASLRWLVAFTPIEDEVRYLVRSEDLVRPRPKDELDRISAIALSRSIRSSDGDEPEFEIDDDLSPEGLEILHLDPFQMHPISPETQHGHLISTIRGERHMKMTHSASHGAPFWPVPFNVGHAHGPPEPPHGHGGHGRVASHRRS